MLSSPITINFTKVMLNTKTSSAGDKLILHFLLQRFHENPFRCKLSITFYLKLNNDLKTRRKPLREYAKMYF